MLSNRIAVDSWGKLWGGCPRCLSRRARVDRFSCCDDVWRTAGLRTRPWSNRRGDSDDQSKDVRELIAPRRNRWLRLVVALEPSMWSIFHGWCVDRFCVFLSVARCEMRWWIACIVSSRHEKVELRVRVTNLLGYFTEDRRFVTSARNSWSASRDIPLFQNIKYYSR